MAQMFAGAQLNIVHRRALKFFVCFFLFKLCFWFQVIVFLKHVWFEDAYSNV